MSTVVQQYETDALQEHPDSTPILIDRLANWRATVIFFQNYANHQLSIQTALYSGLEKTRRTLSEPPQFGGQAHEGSAVQDHLKGTSGFADGFLNLQAQNDTMLAACEGVINSFRNSIIPPLDVALGDIDKHYKMLKSQGNKGIREVEKARDQTQKLIERLGRFTASYGVQKIDTKDDPYVLHRRTLASIADQVQRENTQAEAALSVQNSFASLERHVIHVIQQAIANIESTLNQFYQTQAESHSSIARSFNSIDLDQEWNAFTDVNRHTLVPSQNYQRDPALVTFTNQDHGSTTPLIQGQLRRKGTVFKSYSTGFFAVTPTGFLHQFKSQDHLQDPTPELSLYLPDSQLGGLPSRTSGELTFKLLSKDSGKTLARSHKYTFKAASYEELLAWHTAISKVTGNSAAFDEDAESPVDPQDEEPAFPAATAGGVAGAAGTASGPTSPRVGTEAAGGFGAGFGTAGATPATNPATNPHFSTTSSDYEVLGHTTAPAGANTGAHAVQGEDGVLSAGNTGAETQHLAESLNDRLHLDTTAHSGAFKNF